MIQPSHNEFMEQVTDLMKLYGWEWLHVRKSIGKQKRWQTTTNIVGWPDIWGFHPRHGFLAIEIKVGRDKPTPEQTKVLASLAAAGAQTLVAYPSDLEAVQALLAGKKP